MPWSQNKNKKLGSIRISWKLNISFSILVLFSIIVGMFNFFIGQTVTDKILEIEQLHFPSTLAISRAKSDLLSMEGEIRAYLALSNIVYIDKYNKAQENFKQNLDKLHLYNMSFQDKKDLRIIRQTFQQWIPIIEHLLVLHTHRKRISQHCE